MTLARKLSAAFEEGAKENSWIAGSARLKNLDPLVRVAARARFAKILERARRATTLDDPAHVLRLAALLAVKPEAECDFDDPASVRAELAALGPRTIPKQGPWWTLGAGALLVGIVVGALFLRRALAPFDARATPAGRALGEGLTRFVAAVNRDAASERSVLGGARAATTGPEARRAFGDDGVARLVRLLDGAEKVARDAPVAPPVPHPVGDPEPKPAPEVEAFLRGVQDFDVFLRQKALPFFVDAEVLGSPGHFRPLLMSSYVEREVELEAAGKHVRALHVWRLDTLGVRLGALGYTRPRTPAALVLLDQIESDLVRWVLPALPAGETLEMVDEDTEYKGEAWVKEIEARAAEVVRRHYAGARLDGAMQRVGQLLARRRALVRKWRASLSGQGIELVLPERLVPELDYAKELEIRITRENLREWDALHGELLTPRLLAAFAKFRDAYTLSVERHETQHRLDFMGGMRPLPDVVARLLGIERTLDSPEGSLPERTSAELSAYLAELAQGSDSPLLDLVLMSRLALSRLSLGTPHSYAAVGALLTIGREFGVDADGYLERGMRRANVAELLLLVASREPAAIRDAAAKAYAQCFGEPLVTTRRLSVREHEHWRH